MGLQPDTFYRMTPREMDALIRGQRARVTAQAVAVAAGFSGDLKVIDVFFGGDPGPKQMSRNEYEALKERMGYATAES